VDHHTFFRPRPGPLIRQLYPQGSAFGSMNCPGVPPRPPIWA